MVQDRVKKSIGGLIFLAVMATAAIRLYAPISTSENNNLESLLNEERRLDLSGHPMKDLARQSKTLIRRTQEGLVAEGHKPGTRQYDRLLHARTQRRMAARAGMLEEMIADGKIAGGEENKRHLEDVLETSGHAHPLRGLARQSDTVLKRTQDGLVAEGLEPGTGRYDQLLQNRMDRRMQSRAMMMEEKIVKGAVSNLRQTLKDEAKALEDQV